MRRGSAASGTPLRRAIKRPRSRFLRRVAGGVRALGRWLYAHRIEGVLAASLLGVTAAVAAACLAIVDFTPRVSPHFFFAADDPQLQAETRIMEQFDQPSQLILSVRGDVHSKAYQRQLRYLTRDLRNLPGVFSVFSMAKGPRGRRDALESPLWKRVLVVDEGKASNVIVFVKSVGEDPLTATTAEGLIGDVEAIVRERSAADFEIVVSGVPYIIELMRRYLQRDFTRFSALAGIVFGIMILLLVRSPWIMVGMLLACLNAGALTLLAAHAFGVRVGLLTANLATIVFTLTLSHMVFMTFNWQRARQEAGDDRAALARTVRMTWSPSFWSMLTTLLGFISLYFVEAEPLRRLGMAGSIGTLVAFVVAYAFHPASLWVTRGRPLRIRAGPRFAWVQRLLTRPRPSLVAWIILACAVVGTGVARLQRDPSLLSYFAEDSELHAGLAYIDRHLGSSPMTIVVREPSDGSLISDEGYQKLWEAQLALEQKPEVGSVVSLPVIMAEGRRVPLLGRLLPWNWLMGLLETPLVNRIGRYFVTEDRTQGLFLLLMRESARHAPRADTVQDLVATVEARGLQADLVGGVYVLQGKLARLVIASLAWGLALLALLFVVMVLGLTRSWRITAAVLASVALLPVWMLGVVGHLRIPFDVISAPAANLAMAMGVDAMIHLLSAVKARAGARAATWDDWASARRQLWRPVLYSTVIVCAGFGIFAVSEFPPTQRFGLAIVAGTALVPCAALLVLPELDSIFRRSS